MPGVSPLREKRWRDNEDFIRERAEGAIQIVAGPNMADVGVSLEGLFLGDRLSLKGADVELSAKFYFPVQELLKHVFIYGKSGSGKTVLIKIFLEELVLHGIPSIAVDLNGDLSSLGFLTDSSATKYPDFLVKANEDSEEKVRQKLKFDTEQFGKYGLTGEHVEKLRESSEFAVFTPGSDKGIPLAISSLVDAPVGIENMYEQERDTVIQMVDFISRSLLDRVYGENKTPHVEKEKEFISELILYAWFNDIGLEGPKGLERFIELMDKPPFDELNGYHLNEYFSLPQRQHLVQQVKSFLTAKEYAWYKGVPLDIDLLCGKYLQPGKTSISVINISDLTDVRERHFVVSRLCYAIYLWSRHKGNSGKPRVIFSIDGFDDERGIFYPSDNEDVMSKKAIDLLLTRSADLGVCCILSAKSIQKLNRKVLDYCGTWFAGRLTAEEERNEIIENITTTDMRSDRLDAMLSSMQTGKFLVKLHFGGAVLIKERWLLSCHCFVPLASLPDIMEQEVKVDFKAFYVSGKISGQEGLPRESTSVKSGELMPENIYENFKFGAGEGEPFVLDMEPEDAIRLCLEGLARENISVEEVQFKNARLIVAAGHRADWKIDTLVRDFQGKPVDYVKEEGVYSRFDAHYKLDEKDKEQALPLITRPVSPRSEEICRKVAVLYPESFKLNEIDVRRRVSADMKVSFRDVQVTIKEQNIAVAWKLTLEYRKRIIECSVDIIKREVDMDFPVFSKAEAMGEIKRVYPQFKINDDNVFAGSFMYEVKHSTDDYDYLFRVSKHSCKILKQKVSITERKATEVARGAISREPFQVWKHKNAWNFWYEDGTKLLVDEESGTVSTRKVPSSEEVIVLAREAFVESTGEKDFSIVGKEFNEGVWVIAIESKKWDAHMQVSEDGKVKPDLKLQKEHCFQESKKLLAEYQMPLAIPQRSNIWADGWEFDFLSSLGYFSIHISTEKRELLKKRLTPEGIRHFIHLDFGGEVQSITDREEYWDIVLKKKGKTYVVELSKQDIKILRVKVKKVMVWKEIDVSELRESE